MPDIPTTGQIALLAVSMGWFLVGGLISVYRLRADAPHLSRAARLCFHGGVASAVAVLVWHSIDRRHWLPLEDNFDTFIWMALLLALLLMYVNRSRPIGGLDWFVMPIVILLEVCAAVFGRSAPQTYSPSAWNLVHRLTGFGGAVAFGVAAGTGAMYLLANRRLRAKLAPIGPRLGNLERLEHLTRVSVTLGFALLTIGLLTGLMRTLHGVSEHYRVTLAQPKVVLTFVAWLVYAVVLHSPMLPGLRGRRTAILSIVGFALMVGLLVAVMYMPGERH